MQSHDYITAHIALLWYMYAHMLSYNQHSTSRVGKSPIRYHVNVWKTCDINGTKWLHIGD